MGYWDNQGASPTKVTWKNPQQVPESQRSNGGWYYNPSSGYVERWWSGSAPSSSGGGNNNQQQNQRRKIGERTIITPWEQTEYYLSPEKSEEQATQEIENQGYFRTLLQEAEGDVAKAKAMMEEDYTTAVQQGEAEKQEFETALATETEQMEKAKAQELAERGIVTSEAGRQEQDVLKTAQTTKGNVYQRKYLAALTGAGVKKTRETESKDTELTRTRRQIEADRNAARLQLAQSIRSQKYQSYQGSMPRFTRYEDIYA